ncbi:hypothetical protein SARC_10589 [Sphaeroforma arctica JP610]|uniref:Uncharacterized protein n=1 Tax=Sphaeroforma arctica JP610 TaxID=667725 RepID=A0A0L0FLP3_9EUKA|nr:hypothetical protein SARC_10589 [Sphaeroforma arctica JP610]KNC76938.1 hypothetical protein SARC_10589 [Sphaeroforma arctica JP610]|eukprot:XP_014150840.1 hypothetical protein SARC_10589 [Sphaeroforma arctica JP610]
MVKTVTVVFSYSLEFSLESPSKAFFPGSKLHVLKKMDRVIACSVCAFFAAQSTERFASINPEKESGKPMWMGCHLEKQLTHVTDVSELKRALSLGNFSEHYSYDPCTLYSALMSQPAVCGIPVLHSLLINLVQTMYMASL